jgi:hypothetical protein
MAAFEHFGFMLSSRMLLLYVKIILSHQSLIADVTKRACTNVHFGSMRPDTKLDIYPSLTSNEDAPVIIFIYGGAWMSGDKSHYRTLARNLAKKGYTMYRLYYVVFSQIIHYGLLELFQICCLISRKLWNGHFRILNIMEATLTILR